VLNADLILGGDKFSAEEYNTLKKLPNKSYLIDNESALLLQVVDIIFAYCYDRRTTFFDFTSESHWTIVKLSSVLSCFCDFYDPSLQLKSVLISSYRRALTYPLHRNFELCEKLKEDVSKVFGKGKVEVLKALLNIKMVFERSEPKYLLNRIYIDDFSIWIQKIDEAKLIGISKRIEELKITKEEIELPLIESEELYHIAQD